jgi:hypothetical protein
MRPEVMGGIVEDAPSTPELKRAIWADKITRKYFEKPIRGQEYFSGLVHKTPKKRHKKLTINCITLSGIRRGRFESAKYPHVMRISNKPNGAADIQSVDSVLMDNLLLACGAIL